jgi:hypothetical protein
MSAKPPPEDATSTREAIAEYIAVEASRLARMANAKKLELLAYLIDVAVLEAWREATEARGSHSGGLSSPRASRSARKE